MQHYIISATEARDKFFKLLKAVEGGELIAIKKFNDVVAVLMSIENYALMEVLDRLEKIDPVIFDAILKLYKKFMDDTDFKLSDTEKKKIKSAMYSSSVTSLFMRQARMCSYLAHLNEDEMSEEAALELEQMEAEAKKLGIRQEDLDRFGTYLIENSVFL